MATSTSTEWAGVVAGAHVTSNLLREVVGGVETRNAFRTWWRARCRALERPDEPLPELIGSRAAAERRVFYLE